MNIAVGKKPRRVNIAALLNILVGVVGLSVILLLAKDPDVTSKIQIDTWRLWTGAALILLLVLTSAWALLGRRNSHLIMLGVATVFYGTVIYQNASSLGHAAELFSQDGETHLWANIVRTSLELALTVWAALSSKTRSYFSARYGAP